MKINKNLEKASADNISADILGRNNNNNAGLTNISLKSPASSVENRNVLSPWIVGDLRSFNQITSLDFLKKGFVTLLKILFNESCSISFLLFSATILSITE